MSDTASAASATSGEPSSNVKRISFGPKTQRGANDCLTMGDLASFWKRVSESKTISADVSEEVATTLTLAQRIRTSDLYIEGATQRISFILDCLLKDAPDVAIAREARITLQLDVYRTGGFISQGLAKLSQAGPVTVVLAALAFSLMIWLIVVFIVRAVVTSTLVSVKSIGTMFFFMNDQALAVMVSAAFIGGVISIASRLREFSRVRDLDPFAMFWTALLKPLIGVVLAVFILAALFGKIISFGFLDAAAFDADTLAVKTLYVLWVLGFLAGFSERFAWDFVDRAQGVANGGPGGANAAQAAK